MIVQHPRAGDGPGVPPARVDVNGTNRPVSDDGTFEVDSEAWLRRFAERHDVSPAELICDSEETPDATAPFDPSEFTVDELREEVQTIDDVGAVEAVLSLERGGKNRETATETIHSWLDALRADDSEE